MSLDITRRNLRIFPQVAVAGLEAVELGEGVGVVKEMDGEEEDEDQEEDEVQVVGVVAG
eukprot:CAMPEP_0185269336 /NCGR_PEP_ID=MMETSP1359-20130426/39479_1 /TAXON_ID=552665 /ORGANISM="Bigelowiella longifila, Strain CCMP242" /LENGTH=58 /DNA_ID=CAMNT_0027860445 /DNA_START=252 /DNA_END=424 /DNA_ORIENTATION=-